MATVNFLYRSSKENANLVVRLLYRYNSTDYVYGTKTNIEVSKSYWKNEHKSNSRDIIIRNKQIEINNEINKLERHIIKTFNDTNIIDVNKEWLKSIVFNYYNPIMKLKDKIPSDLVSIASHYIKSKENDNVAKATLTKYKTIRDKMLEFQTYRNRIIYVKDIDLSFKDEFQNYYNEKKYSQNTASRELDSIKTFCYYAKSLSIETSPQLNKVKIKKIKAEKIYLTFEELEVLEKLDKTKLSERLINARDWLIISCYLGQRVSDFLRFKKEMIRYEKNKQGIEKPLIEFIQQKTGKLMTIPIPEKVVEYLNKRNGEFPYKIADQNYNDYIKEVAEIAGFQRIIYGSIQKNTSKKKGKKIMRGIYGKYPKYKLITSHIGRRSFATNFYGKIPTNYLCYMTGHSTEKAFLEYIGKSNKDTALELTEYF